MATLSFVALTGFLVGPLLIGSVTQVWGIGTELAVLLPMLLLSAIYAPLLSRGART